VTTGTMPVVDVKGRSAGHIQGIIYLNPEIPDGTLELRMAEQSRFIMHLGLTH
jgi:hypothetical protein